jgi:hypothetical protein
MATPTNLPAAQTSGNVLTAAYVNDLRGAFRILQVISATTTSTASTTSGTFATTNLTASITPQSTSSKIAIYSSSFIWNPTANTEAALRLARGATQLYLNFPLTSAANNYGFVWSCIYLDSPATTSSTTYTVEFRRVSGAGTITAQVNNGESSIILLEVSA